MSNILLRKSSVFLSKKQRKNSNLLLKNIKIIQTKDFESEILFHYGENTEKPIEIYIVDGCIDTLKIKENQNTLLTENQFKEYINTLYSFKEFYLLDVILEKNKYYNYKPEKIQNTFFSSTQTLLKKLNIEILKGNNPSQIKSYYTYFFTLGKSYNYGDKIDLNKDEKLNNIYILTSNSYVSLVPENHKNEYREKFRNLQIRREHVQFLQSLSVFNMLLKENFDKNLYDKFTFYHTQQKKILTGQNIINEGDNADNVYFIKSGFFEVYGYKSLNEIDNLIQSLYKQNKELIDEEYEDKFNVRLNNRKDKILFGKKEVKLARLGKGDFFGFYNYIKNNKFIFSVKLISQKGEFFSISLKDFLQICNDVDGIIPVFNNLLNQKKEIYLNQLINIENILLNNEKNLGSVVDIYYRKKKSKESSYFRKTYFNKSFFPIEKYYSERKQLNTINNNDDKKIYNNKNLNTIEKNKRKYSRNKKKINSLSEIKLSKIEKENNEKENSDLYSMLIKTKENKKKNFMYLSKGENDNFDYSIEKKTRNIKLNYPIFNKTYFSKNLYSNFHNYSNTLTNTSLISNNKGQTISTIDNSEKLPLSYQKNSILSNFKYFTKRMNQNPYFTQYKGLIKKNKNLPMINTTFPKFENF